MTRRYQEWAKGPNRRIALQGLTAFFGRLDWGACNELWDDAEEVGKEPLALQGLSFREGLPPRRRS